MQNQGRSSNKAITTTITEETNIDLYHRDHAPHFLVGGNPHIHRGYRAFLSPYLCFKSLFVLSNEFVNVWSHLAGFMWAWWQIIMVNYIQDPDDTCISSGAFVDRFLITLYLLCIQFCMICSTLFHLLCCQSEHEYRRWLRWDLFGIVIGIMGCYFPGVYYAFYCSAMHRDGYMYCVALMFGGAIAIQLHPEWSLPRWRLRRIITYFFVLAFGVVPVMHWTVMHMHNSVEVSLFLYRVVMAYLLALIGFIFYISLFPECLFPGKVDIIGHSHQWWHLLTLAGFIWWYHSGLELCRYRHTHPCLAT